MRSRFLRASRKRRLRRDRLKQGLSRTRDQWAASSPASSAPHAGRRSVARRPRNRAASPATWASTATEHLLDELRKAASATAGHAGEHPEGARAEVLARDLLQPLSGARWKSAHKPFVIMIAGVNGAGKTTSIGKLAKHFQNAGQERAAGRRRHLPRRGARAA